MHNLELKVRCPDEATLDALIARAIDGGAPIDAAALTLIAAEDIRASRVFAEASAHASNADTPDAPDAPDAHHTAPAPPG